MRKYLIPVLILALIAAGWRYGAAQYDAGATAERAEWQARDLARQAEIQKLQNDRDQARLAAEQAKAKIVTKTVEVVRESRKIKDACADTAVEPDLYSLYTH